jgi:hypothetical protein
VQPARRPDPPFTHEWDELPPVTRRARVVMWVAQGLAVAAIAGVLAVLVWQQW